MSKEYLQTKRIANGETSSMEYAAWMLKPRKNMNLLVIGMYRAPYSTKHPVTINIFFNEFAGLLSGYLPMYNNITIIGDFLTSTLMRRPTLIKLLFMSCVLHFGLVQNVNCVTHESGHTLDFILTRNDSTVASQEPHSVWKISDHYVTVTEL